MPIAASVMGVAAVGWVAMTLNGPDGEVQRWPAPAVVASAAPVERVSRASVESSEREYLFAHQAMAPAAGMPGVAHYVRTVSDTRVAAER
jgi:sigma-E factor negative regulatory protein RseA